jgi:2,4-dienoyl-CoA reductase-like NADH-dependent reductase (Old Yellow Enzyme family)
LKYIGILKMGSIISEGTPTGASSKLFSSLRIANGDIELKHRIVMSPMTRNRGVPLAENTPESPNRIWVADELIAKYYSQRASDHGLIITESILPSPESGAMPGVPGMWLPEHVAGWKLVSDDP